MMVDKTNGTQCSIRMRESVVARTHKKIVTRTYFQTYKWSFIHIHKNKIEVLSERVNERMCVCVLFYARHSKFSLISELESNFLALLWNEEEISLVLSFLPTFSALSLCVTLSFFGSLYMHVYKMCKLFHCYSSAIYYRLETLFLSMPCMGGWFVRSFIST